MTLYYINAFQVTHQHFKKIGLDKIPSHGPLPVSVPGAVDGWFELHKRFGALPMTAILAPAIRYAREGFPLTEIIAAAWQRSAPRLEKWAGFRETFMPNGRAPAKGEIFKNPNLANTLEQIANGGRDVFYKGEIAKKIDLFMEEVGGFLSYEDLANHKSDWVEPVSTNYRGYDVWELPPNGQGIAALQILNILENYDIASMGFGSPDYIHRFIEAKKLAFEDRAKFYADPDFNKIPVERLISKEYAASRLKLIDPKHAATHYEADNPVLEEGDTIYLTVADKSGNMVSLIQSNYRGMGTGLSPANLGFIFQDRGELFNLEEGHFNTYEPKKRPFHTIIPAFVTKDGKPFISFGVMGGPVQPQMHAQVLINLIDFNMNLQEAGDAPRVVHSGSSQPTGEKMTNGGVVSMERGISDETIQALVRMGHRIEYSIGGYGGYQAIMKDLTNGVYYGASESRKDGQASGY